MQIGRHSALIAAMIALIPMVTAVHAAIECISVDTANCLAPQAANLHEADDEMLVLKSTPAGTITTAQDVAMNVVYRLPTDVDYDIVESLTLFLDYDASVDDVACILKAWNRKRRAWDKIGGPKTVGRTNVEQGFVITNFADCIDPASGDLKIRLEANAAAPDGFNLSIDRMVLAGKRKKTAPHEQPRPTAVPSAGAEPGSSTRPFTLDTTGNKSGAYVYQAPESTDWDARINRIRKSWDKAFEAPPAPKPRGQRSKNKNGGQNGKKGNNQKQNNNNNNNNTNKNKK